MKFNIPKRDIKEFIILGVIALGCLLYVGFRERNDMNYTLPLFPEIDTADFTALEILSPEGKTLKMTKDGGGWLLGDDYPADPAIVDRILGFLSTPSPVDLVSESGKYGRYELDEEGRHILKGYGGESLMREIHLGKISSSSKYNYVLFPGNKNVYTVRGSMVETASKNDVDFRDKLILEIDRNSITELTFRKVGIESMTLAKVEDVWSDENGREWDKNKIDEMLGRFISLHASGFPSDIPTEDEKIAELGMRGVDNIALILYEKGDDGYPATSSAYPFPVIISSYIGDSILESFTSEEK